MTHAHTIFSGICVCSMKMEKREWMPPERNDNMPV
jgi:hypothetical protein